MALGFGFKRSNLGVIEKKFKDSRRSKAKLDHDDSLSSESSNVPVSPQLVKNTKINSK